MEDLIFTRYERLIIECRRHLVETSRILDKLCDEYDLSTRDKEKIRETREKALGAYLDLLEIWW